MSDKPSDFVSLALAGKVTIDQIDDYVSGWHAGDSDLELHDYLGLTRDEYALWMASADMLSVIIASRKLKRPLAEMAENDLMNRSAARSDDQLKTTLIRNWLIIRIKCELEPPLGSSLFYSEGGV